MNLNLLVNWFESEERGDDFEFCLKKNQQVFDRIVMLRGWCTFNDFFDVGNRLDGVNVIANLDIYFDQTAELLKNVTDGVVYCITRHEGTKKGEVRTFKDVNYGVPGEWSQDVWVYTGGVNIDGNFRIGMPGCDNHIAWKLHEGGYKLLNPAEDIRCIHIHPGHNRSNRRSRVGARHQYMKVDVTNLKMI